MVTPNPSISIQMHSLNSIKASQTPSKHARFAHGWTNEIEADFKNLVDYIRSNSELYLQKSKRRSWIHRGFVISTTLSCVLGVVCSSSNFLSCTTSNIVGISTGLTSASLTLLNSMFNFSRQEIVYEQMSEAFDNLARKIQVELYKPPSSRPDPLTFSLEIESVETKIMKRESELNR